jgi:hypothetical protein
MQVGFSRVDILNLISGEPEIQWMRPSITNGPFETPRYARLLKVRTCLHGCPVLDSIDGLGGFGDRNRKQPGDKKCAWR